MQDGGEEETYQQIYQQLLRNNQLQPLAKFKSTRGVNIPFPDAHKYPEFFNNNLLSPGRVIKVVRDNHALLKGFYYQLMKLTFEIEVNQLDYIEIFKSVIFHPGLLLDDTDMQSPSSGRTYTDKQYKRILAEFVQLMMQQGIPNFEFTVMEYPIIDEALTKTFEGLMTRCYRGSNNTQDILEWLCKTFSVQMQRHGKCYRFQESDIFLYEENEFQYYLAFLNQMAEVSDQSESTYRMDQRRSVEDRKSRTDRDFKSASNEKASSQVLEDYPLASDKYRYSAQLEYRKSDDTTVHRKTIDNKSFIKDLAREVDESLQNDKPSQKQSKIGSLLDIMSDRSSKDIPNKNTDEHQTQHLSERLQQKQTNQIISQKVLYDSQFSQQFTPKFQTNAHLNLAQDHYNPFTKKYSEQYMGNFYDQHHKFDYLTANLDQKYIGTGNYDYSSYEPAPIQTNTYSYKYESNFLPSPSIQPQINLYDYSKPTQSNLYGYNDYKYKEENNDFHHDRQYSFQKNGMLADSQERFRTPKEQEELFYNPKGSKPKISTNIDALRPDKQQDSKGTLYRQFTDTKVLQAMTSFDRMKVNTIRKKYRGMHRRDLTKLY